MRFEMAIAIVLLRGRGGIREDCGTQLSLDYVPQDLSGHVTSSILRLVSRRHFSFELCFRTRTVGESHEVL